MLAIRTAGALGLLAITGGNTMTTQQPLEMQGSWEMTQAYEILADGTRVTNYGEHPAGLMLVDGEGRYAIQIYRRDRPDFASGVKATGTEAELRAAVNGSSTHFGRVAVDPEQHILVFSVEASSFPNWQGKKQVREYSFAGGQLSYAVPAAASGNGTVAWSVWRKLS